MTKIMITGYFDPAASESNIAAFTSPDKPKYPEYVKKVESLVAGTGDFKTYTIYEVPNDKIYESLQYLNRRQIFYASKMSGYEYNIEIVGPIEDAIATLK